MKGRPMSKIVKILKIIALVLAVTGPLYAVPMVNRQFFSFTPGNYALVDPDNGTGINYTVGGATLTFTDNVLALPTYAVLGGPLPPSGNPFVNPTPFSTQDEFLARLTGFFNVAASATYTFQTGSDDGSYLFIDGALVVDNGGLHGTEFQSNLPGGTFLTAGLHTFQLQFAENQGGNTLGIFLPAGVTLGEPVPELNVDSALLPMALLSGILLVLADRRISLSGVDKTTPVTYGG